MSQRVCLVSIMGGLAAVLQTGKGPVIVVAGLPLFVGGSFSQLTDSWGPAMEMNVGVCVFI